MTDLVKLILKAGDGGNGRVSFRREKYVPKGGPDGGKGGDGGNVIIRGTSQLSTLTHFSGAKEFKAESGQPGGKQRMYGRQGGDLVLEVPIGTVVWLLAENKVSRERTKYVKVGRGRHRNEIRFKKFYLEREGQFIEPLQDTLLPVDQLLDRQGRQDSSTAAQPGEDSSSELTFEAGATRGVYKKLLEKSDSETEGEWHVVDHPDADDSLWQEEGREDGGSHPAGPDKEEWLKLLTDKALQSGDFRTLPKYELIQITEEGQEVVVCQGGFGGRGNDSFKSASNTTPLEAEYGTLGEVKIVALELKLLADVGFVGFPNAGKSTLLARLTQARPKVANYPFTTLEPQLGVMGHKGHEMVLADIPGLIEGAHQGKGLGYTFLRHVENCQVLLFVLALDDAIVFDTSLTDKEKAKLLWQQYQNLLNELALYQDTLAEKRSLLIINKIDIYSPEMIEAFRSQFKQKSDNLMLLSGVTGEGVEALKNKLLEIVTTHKATASTAHPSVESTS